MRGARLSRPSLVLGLALLAMFATVPQARAQVPTDQFKIEIVPNILHSREVPSVAFSPDGVRVLSGSDDKTLKLWNTDTGQLIRTFAGHSGSVTSVAFSPDGRRVLSSTGSEVKLWDAATGKLIGGFDRDSGGASTVAFSPNGARVLSGSANGTLKLWNASTRKLIRAFAGHTDAVRSVAFSPDGGRVISGSADHTLKLWTAATGQLIRTFGGDGGAVNSVAFSPDGTRVLSGSAEGELKLWDAATGQPILTFEERRSGYFGIYSVSFSPDGGRVLSGGRYIGPALWPGGRIGLKLWDTATGKLITRFPEYSRLVYWAAFSPDGKRVLTVTSTGEFKSSEEAQLKLWDATTGKLIHTFGGTSDVVWSVAFSSNGSRVVSRAHHSRGGGALRLWDAGTGQLIRALERDADRNYQVEFSPDGTRTISWSREDMTLRLYDAATGQLVGTLDDHTNGVYWIKFSPDGSRVFAISNAPHLWDAATGQVIRTFESRADGVSAVVFSPNSARMLSWGNEDKTLRLWDAATGQLISTLEGHADGYGELIRSLDLEDHADGYGVTFSPDGSRVFAGGNAPRLWNTATGQVILAFESQTDKVQLVEFSPDGKRMVSRTGTDDRTPRLWDAATGQLVRTLEGHARGVDLVAFSPDGTRVVSGSTDETLRVWATATGKLIRTIEGHTDGAYTAAVFSPDGTRVLAGNTDKTLNLWDAATGRLMHTFKGHLYSVISVAFSPDGRRIVSGGADGTTRLWDADSGLQVAILFGGRDRRWLTLTPTGFFAGSRSANDLFGIVRGLKLTTIDQVRQSLFNPDLVREVLAGDPDGEVARAAKVINLEKVLDSGPPPSVAIVSPEEDSQSAAAIGQDELQDWLANRIKVRKALVLLDTCESGALIAGYARSRTDTPASEAAVGRLHEATGRPVLAATAAGQNAGEGLIAGTHEGHGYFTWAVLDALRYGDSNGDGLIEISELAAHVQSILPKVAAGIVVRAGGSELAASTKQAAHFGWQGEDFAIARRLP